MTTSTGARDRIPDDRLVEMIRDGDREAASAFVARYAPLLKRRIRGKIARAMRDVTDTYDVLSTVLRRLDGAVLKAAVRAESVGQLVTYIGTIADRAVLEKGRARSTLVSQLGNSPATEPVDVPSLGDLDSKAWWKAVLESSGDDLDRAVLWLWLNRCTSQQIGESLGLDPTTVRKRLERIRARVRDVITTML